MKRHHYELALALFAAGLLPACIRQVDYDGATMGSFLDLEYNPAIEQASHKICGTNSTFRGIDVSKWNGTVNWSKVASDSQDIKFAIARVSDGLKYPDAQFDNNWKGIKEAGLVRGVYQFFRPSQDAVQQADYLLSKIGSKLEPNDLPPVIDVEADENMSDADIAKGIKAWIERVESVLGVKPIIYTGAYFWDGHVNSSDFKDYPLWHAAYPTTWSQSTSCPAISNKWDNWAMWQYSSSAHIQGIGNGTSDVDINVVNGTIADLLKLTASGACGQIEPKETIIDDTDSCFFGGGNTAYLRHDTSAGYGNSLTWTKTWVADHVGNYGQWNFDFMVGGKYRIETYITPDYGEFSAVPYKITHNGETTTVRIDQSTGSGWKTVGTYYFAAGGDQNVVIEDVVGNTNDAGKKLVFDAIKVVPVELDEATIDYTAVCVDVPAEGRVIDETEACFSIGGKDPEKWMHHLEAIGYENHLYWTHSRSKITDEAYTTGNFSLSFIEAGKYEAQVYIPGETKAIETAGEAAMCNAVKYDVKHDGVISQVTLDQSSITGWYSLGEFDFAAGGDQYIQIRDNVDEEASMKLTIAIDAIRLDRVYDKTDEGNNNITFTPPTEENETEEPERDSFIEESNNNDSEKDNLDDKPLIDDNNNNDNNSGNVVIVTENPADDGTAAKGCNSQAGDSSLLMSLLLASMLMFNRRRSSKNC